MAKIHFLNVDEGDCSIIEHDNGHITVVDVCCGNIGSALEKAFSVPSVSENVKGNFNQKAHPTNPITYLQRLGVKSIFRYIQTHPDMDHMDGLNQLDKKFKIWNFWDTRNTKPSPSFDKNAHFGKYKKEDWDCYCKLRKSKDAPKALFYLDGSQNKYFAEDDKGILTDDYIKILSPTEALLKSANENQDWNDSSYVILYCIHGYKILFCGDADDATLFHLTTNHKTDISNIDVLIAPHHGRDSDKDFGFLDVMNPTITLMGNAKSKYLAYDEWNNRDLVHFTNNQVGDVLMEINDDFVLSASNKTFADKYNEEHFHHKAEQNGEFYILG